MKLSYVLLTFAFSLVSVLALPAVVSAQVTQLKSGTADNSVDLISHDPIRVPDRYSIRTHSQNVYQAGLSSDHTASLLSVSLAYLGIGTLFLVIDLIINAGLMIIQGVRRLFTRREQFVYFGDWNS